VDLYLIHWPISVNPGTWEILYPEEALTSFDLKGVWKAMEECQKQGLTKFIGVSNFSCHKLENLLSFATIPPSVNQVSYKFYQRYVSSFQNDNPFWLLSSNRLR